MSDVVTDFKNAQAAQAAAEQRERDAVVAHVKSELRESYERAKRELPRFRDALSAARAFITPLEGVRVPASVLLAANDMVRTIGAGDALCVAGIETYDALTFEDLTSGRITPEGLRSMLNNWDGKVGYLASVRGQIETMLRERAPSQTTPAGH